MKYVPLLAILMIAVGLIGLAAVASVVSSSPPLSNTPPSSSGRGHGMMSGMMHGMMSGMHSNANLAPNSSVTPIPADTPIDREITIITRNDQFIPARVQVTKGETVKITLANEDPESHNFVNPEVPYLFVAPKSTGAIVWSAAEAKSLTVRCTLHPGMDLQLIVQ